MKFSILILGDWNKKKKTYLLKIKKELKKLNCHASLLSCKAKICDNLAEKIAIHRADLIIMVDGCGEGTVSEATKIIENPAYQNKVIYFVKCKDHRNHINILKNLKAHYIHFPRLFHYKTSKHLIPLAVHHGHRAVYLMAQNNISPKAIKKARVEKTTLIEREEEIYRQAHLNNNKQGRLYERF